MAGNLRGDARATIAAGLDSALDKQRPVAVANVARLRQLHPDKTAEELVAYFENWYLGTVSYGDVAVDRTVSGPDGVVEMPAALGDFLAYVDASVLFILEAAEVQGLVPEDHDRRKLLVLSALVGDADGKALEPLIGEVGPLWGPKIVDGIPLEAVVAANETLGSRIDTTWGDTGAPVPGRHAAVKVTVDADGDGDGLFGWRAVTSARKILGPARAQ